MAYNVARWRKAAGLTQQQLGDRIGLSENAVSEAERSFAGARTRQFDADLLAGIAVALGIPVVALLLPPPGCTFRAPGAYLDRMALMQLLFPDSDAATAVMGEYRDTWNDAAMELIGDDPGQAALIARWMSDTAERRAEVAASLRAEGDAAVLAGQRAAAKFSAIADAIEQGEAP